MLRRTGIAAFLVLAGLLASSVSAIPASAAANPTVSLTIAATNGGSGRVQMDPGAIVCTTSCTGSWVKGTAVKLTATPNTGSSFAGWSGACTGTSTTCNISLASPVKVTATFSLNQYLLRVTKTGGSGAGTVTSSTGGINCGTTCQATYFYNATTPVTLTATAASGSQFTGWTGCTSSSGTSCSVLMTQARDVNAVFQTLRTVTFAKSGTGTGTITATTVNGTVTCAAACTSQSASLPDQSQVTVTATATAASGGSLGSFFSGWAGNGCTTSGTCQFTVTSSVQTTTATFVPNHSLAVAWTGNGSGGVTSSPAGISCSPIASACSFPYPQGTAVTLTATPSTGSYVAGWTINGLSACGTSTTCSVTVGATTSVVVTFTLYRFNLTAGTSGTGLGTVAVSPVGTSCGAGCWTYDYGTSVSILPTADVSSTFTGWSGDCGGSGACSVSVTAARSVTAQFTLRTFSLDLTIATDSSIEGIGGSVALSRPSGDSCTDSCVRIYDYDAVSPIVLTAEPKPGYAFAGWGGACTSLTGVCAFPMTANRTVTANFVKLWSLTVSKDGSGVGGVSTSPAGIDCAVPCTSPASADFRNGTFVTVTASPDISSTFAGWSGDSSGSCDDAVAACTVTLDAARAVTATFTIKTFTFSVDPTGAGDASGSGTVTLTPDGDADAATTCVTSDGACSATYTYGTVVDVTAEADADSAFTGWSGACEGTDACQVTMTAAASVVAMFPLTRTLTVSIDPDANGAGSLTWTPAGLGCDTPCSDLFPDDQWVTLTAAADIGSEATWGGDCQGVTDDVCYVDMEYDREVSVAFTLIRVNLTVETPTHGSISLAGSDGACPTVCGTYDYFDEVTLVATPAEGYHLVSWGGDCVETDAGDCAISMEGDKVASATFAITIYPVALEVSGNGSGAVTWSPSADGPCTDDCTRQYDWGTDVTLTADPDLGSHVDGWGDACGSSTGDTCALTVKSALDAAITFTLDRHDVTVSKAGSGGGTVAVSPAGEPCGPNCSTYDYGTLVTFTATDDGASRFAGWQVYAPGTEPGTTPCPGTGSCAIYVGTTDLVVVATFVQQWTVTAARTGTGSGTVASADNLISCGSTCVHTYDQGTSVTLQATTPTGSSFSAWTTGPCVGSTSSSCTFTVAETTTATASFAVNVYDLAFTKDATSTGVGLVTSSPPGDPTGIACDTTCTGQTVKYSHGTSVLLTATPPTGYGFAGWSGACTNTTGTCTVVMDGPKSVSARFVLAYLLTVAKSGNGAGSISGTLACGNNGKNPCTSVNSWFNEGTAISLSAAPATSSDFGGWSSPCSGTGSCTFTIGRTTDLSASFTLKRLDVTLTMSGTGAGTVTLTPSTGSPTSCSASCTRTFDYGTSVTLSATPSPDSPMSAFTSWSGACSGTAPCALSVTSTQNVTATFTKVIFTLSLTKTRNAGGNGTVTATSVGGTNTCDAACSAASWTYDGNTSVTLTATPDTTNGGYFAGWSGGGCSGTDPCVVSMTVARSVTATFATPQQLTVTVNGRGTGGVSGGGISCPGTCSITVPYGDTVYLEAFWGADSNFGGWSIPAPTCGSNALCPVIMDGAKSVTATFNPPSVQLSLSKNPTDGGTGTVISAVDGVTGLTCGPTCSSTSYNHLYGDTVVLTATASSDSYFTGWGGACAGAGTAATCTLVLDGETAVSVSATFGRPVLTVVRSGAGTGKVTGDVSPTIRCGTTCSQLYPMNAVVTLTATERQGSFFGGWIGPCESFPDATSCTVRMDRAKEITAVFTTTATTYAVTVGISGSGTITSSPAGISCGSTCTASFSSGSLVTLTATPTSGGTFTAWTSGPCAGSSNSVCTFSVSSDTTITATFSP